MILWILIAALTAAAALLILVPLAKARPDEAGDIAIAETADEAVYKQQLAEVDRDLDRGLIDAAAAGAARTEIARRLLAANERARALHGRPGSKLSFRMAQGVAVVALPAFALGLYLVLGSPDLGDQPLSARLQAPAEDQSVEVLIARVENHLASNPEDGQGWAVVAPVYMRVGKPQQAARAYGNAIRLLGVTAEMATDMGEAMTVANDGIVSAAARTAFEQAVALDPDAVKPRFFLALALGQENKTDEAIAAWQDLLKNANPQEAWVPVAMNEMRKLGGDAPLLSAGPAGGPVAGPVKGPSEDQVAAVSQMAPEDRQQMIAGMVAGLAERLATHGGSVAEWAQLLRAYTVLGERDKAEAALKSAVAAYQADPAASASIMAAARDLGLTVPN